MHPIDRMPRRILQPLIDRLPAGNQIDVDGLQLAAGDQTIAGITRGRDEIKAAFIHQGHHFVGRRGDFVIDFATGVLLELRDPIVGRIRLAALDVADPRDDIDLAFALSDRLERLAGFWCRRLSRLGRFRWLSGGLGGLGGCGRLFGGLGCSRRLRPSVVAAGAQAVMSSDNIPTMERRLTTCGGDRTACFLPWFCVSR
jgi:hypothetical protein